jgi:hypothetical protein
MSSNPDEYFVRIDETLVGRKPGGSAADKARELEAAHPIRSLAARALGKRTDERAWRMGARGERVSRWLLGRLPSRWHVFHDIPVGERGANIDHVVVGPAGVFTVNTKNRKGKVWLAPGTLLVNGHKTDYLPKATREAARASKLLEAALGRPVSVKGVLSIIADNWTIKEKPSDVHVGSPRGVNRWLLDQPPTLSPREVNEIAAAVADPRTWTGTAR